MHDRIYNRWALAQAKTLSPYAFWRVKAVFNHFRLRSLLEYGDLLRELPCALARRHIDIARPLEVVAPLPGSPEKEKVPMYFEVAEFTDYANRGLDCLGPREAREGGDIFTRRALRKCMRHFGLAAPAAVTLMGEFMAYNFSRCRIDPVISFTNARSGQHETMDLNTVWG